MASLKHLQLGAVNKNTNKLEHPCVASKVNKYSCLMCKSDVIFKCGIINVSHFAHKAYSACSFFNKCNNGESECHIKCKSIIKLYLEQHYNFTFTRMCQQSNCKNLQTIKIDDDFYKQYPKFTIALEHRFNFNGHNYCCDIAMLNNTGEIVFMVEIYNSHKTEEERRYGNWVEINAINFLNKFNTNKYNSSQLIQFDCCRQCFNCESCLKIELKKIVTDFCTSKLNNASNIYNNFTDIGDLNLDTYLITKKIEFHEKICQKNKEESEARLRKLQEADQRLFELKKSINTLKLRKLQQKQQYLKNQKLEREKREILQKQKRGNQNIIQYTEEPKIIQYAETPKIIQYKEEFLEKDKDIENELITNDDDILEETSEEELESDAEDTLTNHTTITISNNRYILNKINHALYKFKNGVLVGIWNEGENSASYIAPPPRCFKRRKNLNNLNIIKKKCQKIN